MPIHDNEYIYSLANGSGESISWQDISKEMITDDFIFCTNAKAELYLGTRDRTYKVIPIRQPLSPVTSNKNMVELGLVAESGIIRSIRFEQKSQRPVQSASYELLMQAADKGSLVTAPRWVDALLRVLKKNHEEQVFALVVSSIKNGKIHSELLRQLRLLDLERTSLVRAERQ